MDVVWTSVSRLGGADAGRGRFWANVHAGGRRSGRIQTHQNALKVKLMTLTVDVESFVNNNLKVKQQGQEEGVESGTRRREASGSARVALIRTLDSSWVNQETKSNACHFRRSY